MIKVKPSKTANHPKLEEKKKVLITGAGGSIGMHMLNKVLQDTNWDIVLTDSFRHKGDFDRITLVTDGMPDANKRIKHIVHDLCVPFTERVSDQLQDVDYIIHLASLSDVQDSIDNPVPFISNNVAITLTMLELARKIEPEAFIMFSTDEVYGSDTSKGFGHPEWDTILPSNPYSASKAAQEAIAIAYWRSYGVPVIITNTMNNLGQGQQGSKYPVIIQKKVQAGETVSVHSTPTGEVGGRFYIHSEAAADAILYILSRTDAYKHNPGHLDCPDRYNVAGDRMITNLEIAEMIASLMGKPLDYKLVNFHETNPGHDCFYGLTNKKLKELGWEPPASLEEYLKDTIEWQMKNSEWIKA